MKPIIVTAQPENKFNVQVLKSAVRPGVADYTCFFNLSAADAKKVLEDVAAQKTAALAATTQRVTEDLAEIQSLLDTHFSA